MAITERCPTQDEKVQLFGQLLAVNARLARDLDATLEANCDLPLAWFEVLVRLHQAPEGRLRVSQIADAIVHSNGGTTRLIDRMERTGLVERRLCPSDRRAIHVVITDAGETRLSEALAVHLDFLDAGLGRRLSAVERESLRTLLAKLGDID